MRAPTGADVATQRTRDVALLNQALKLMGCPDIKVLVTQAASRRPISRLENLAAAHVASSRRGCHAF
jgi:hypothetical protein